MEEPTRLLVGRLVRKGVEVTSIPAFIRNVAYTIMNYPALTLDELNGQLRWLGWDGIELDEGTLHVILVSLRGLEKCSGSRAVTEEA